ncbi:MAG: hypothetical protein PHU32_05925, partial [Candidatus ainarchaeum sp.]|nr:hypothetical protein [Candidatus ainarchaeum sp.]
MNRKINIILTIFFLIMLFTNVFAFNLLKPSTWFRKETTNNSEFGGFGDFDGFGGGRSGGAGAHGGFGDEPVSKDKNNFIEETIIIPIIGGSCPGLCGDGFFASRYYPKNLILGNLKYNGSGAICYKCNAEGTHATRCDSRNGLSLGLLNLSTDAGKIIKQEICPDLINIDIALPELNIEDLPVEEIDLVAMNLELKEIGKIYEATKGMFDCSVTEKTTIQERLNLTYNNSNAFYRINDGTRNDVLFDYSSSDISVTINKNRLNTKYFFTQEKDYATACFIEPLNLSELTSNSKRYIVRKNSTIQNGKVIARLNVLPDGKRIEICINRPIEVLTESESKFINSKFLETFTIKQKRTLWFPKKITDITFTLNAELDRFGCPQKLTGNQEQSQISGSFLNVASGEGSCYNPHGTQITGLTGMDNFEKYGFDKLLFIYDIDGIKHNSCDYGEKYCDQDQLKVALLKKAKLIEDQKTISFDEIVFKRSEDNKIEQNTNIYLTDLKNKINLDNLISNDFINSENPEEYLITLTTHLNKIPEELRKFIILDLTFTNKMNKTYVVSLAEEDIKEKVNKLSGNVNHNYLIKRLEETNAKEYLTSEMQDIFSYQINLDVFLRNQEVFRSYLNSNKDDFIFNSQNIVFLTQLIENMRIYYGDAITPTLITTKTYGSLENGLTKDIFEKINFINDLDKKIELLENSEVKQIESPGLYLYELKLENSSIKYLVKNTDVETKKFIDYYNLSLLENYKENLLFTHPINAIYKDYIGIPFKFNDAVFGVTGGPATVYRNYDNWTEVQDGYIFNIISNGSGIENIIFKDIRPIQMTSTSSYNYSYLRSNGRYSNLINKEQGKETVFLFLTAERNNPQLIIESSSEIN